MDNPETNYYELLGVKNDATREEIKQSYHKLLLLYHPDKANTSAEDLTGERAKQLELFCDIEKAWKVLQDDNLRKRYDAKQKAQESLNIGPLHDDELSLSSMNMNQETKCYEHKCRCGGTFCLEEEEAYEFKNTSITLYCDSCSLSIIVNI